VITLEKLTWDNCFSYGTNNTIELNDNTLTQLIGTNGAGKSSIPLILEEVLFNKNSKGIKKADIANRTANNGYDISLDFSVNEDSYHIDVVRRANIKVKLLKNGEDISSHTATNSYKTVEEIIGIDFKTFSQIVYQNTNASLQFLTATDTNRKKFLIDLLQFDKYVAYFDVFRELSRTLGADVSRVQGKIDTIEKWLNDNKLEDTSLLSKMDLPKYSEEDGKTLRSLQIEFENISENIKKINQNNHYRKELESIDIHEFRRLLSQYPELVETDKWLTGLGTWKAEKMHEQSMLDKYQELLETEDHVCPTCGEDIDVEFIKGQMVEHEDRIEACEKFSQKDKERLAEAQEANSIHEEAKRGIAHWEEIYRSIDQNLTSTIPNADELSTQISELSNEYRNYQTDLQEAIDHNNNVERHNTRIGIIIEQETQFESELAELIEGLDTISDKLASVEILKKAFSTNGLLAYKIENLVKDLEELTNEYLAELSDGRFSLEFVVLNDKLNVIIEDNGKSVDILSLSAGELARVNTATLLAIRKLMSSISKSQINILFLDEVTNVLDELGKERLVEILLKEENLNTYIVSHGWTHPLLEKIEVIKENETSRLDG
jgi:DNA repair exonuclease SbcCD ATPase subunit